MWKKIGSEIYYQDSKFSFCRHGHFSAHKRASFFKPDIIFYYEVKYKTSKFDIHQYDNNQNNELDKINLRVTSFDFKINKKCLINKLCYYDNNMIENLLILN